MTQLLSLATPLLPTPRMPKRRRGAVFLALMGFGPCESKRKVLPGTHLCDSEHEQMLEGIICWPMEVYMGKQTMTDRGLRRGPVTGQRSNRPERQPTNGVIECFFRNPEKKRHKPSAIRSVDKFRCSRVAKTRAVTSTI
jgi:hypothetical protein